MSMRTADRPAALTGARPSGRAPREIGLFGLATLLVSGANFALTPILLAALGPDGFAPWARLEPVLLIAIPLAGLGMQAGLMRVGVDRRGAVAQLFLAHLGLAALAGAAAAIILALTGTPMSHALAALVIVTAEGVMTLLLAQWRLGRMPGRYALIEGGRAVAVTGLTLVWLARAGEGADLGGYLGLRASLGAGFLALGVLGLPRITRPDPALVRRAIRFGAPMVAAAALVAALMSLDRYLVAARGDAADLAAYVVHARAAQVLGPALAPFALWFAPLAIRQLGGGAPDHGFLSESFRGFAAAALAMALGLYLGLLWLWPLVFASVAPDPVLLAILVGSMAIFACGNPLSLGSMIEGRTGLALKVTLAAALIGAAAALALAEPLGPVGVALGRGAGLVAYTILFARDTIRHLAIRYPWGDIAALALFALGLGAVGLRLLPLLEPVQAAVLVVGLPGLVLVAALAPRLR